MHSLGPDGISLLNFSICKNGIEILKYIYSLGFNINQPSKDGLTPLGLAAIKGYTQAIDFLIKHGANLETQDSEGFTPLNGSLSVRQFKNIKAIKMLIENGANVNSKSYMCTYPIHSAVYYDSPDLIKLLIDHGANTECFTHNNLSPLLISIAIKKYSSFKALIKYGADIKNKNKDGITPLHYSAMYLPVNLIAYLINQYKIHHYDIDIKENDGLTPLHGAVIHKRIDVAQLLIDEGAYVNMYDYSGLTPLYYAIENGDEEMFNLLQRSGAMVSKILPLPDSTSYREILEIRKKAYEMQSKQSKEKGTVNEQLYEGKIEDIIDSDPNININMITTYLNKEKSKATNQKSKPKEKTVKNGMLKVFKRALFIIIAYILFYIFVVIQ